MRAPILLKSVSLTHTHGGYCELCITTFLTDEMQQVQKAISLELNAQRRLQYIVNPTCTGTLNSASEVSRT
jgi:hypothetical protein